MGRWLLRILILLVPLGVLVAAGVLVDRALSRNTGRASVCRLSDGSASFELDLDQAANATTIAAVGKGMGLPDHAVTIAVATALQESHLRNLTHGDLDSLGLFQQRPSQGWGTPAEILTPSYAARTFYTHLLKVPDWQNRPVTEAAQQVQRSAAPDAYALWEPEARTIAQVLTGEVPAAFACGFSPQAGPTPDPGLHQALADEVGAPAIGVPVDPARGWTVANWLVGHAYQYRLAAVSFSGWRWTVTSGQWRGDRAAGPSVTVDEGP